ncbi:MAG: hypothetical protein AMXMBFR56_56990 [Polyangiaceae bacterium]
MNTDEKIGRNGRHGLDASRIRWRGSAFSNYNYYSMARESGDDTEWKLAAYAEATADETVRQLAWSIANAARTAEDPELSAMDLQAARRYLRACMLRATAAEISAMQRQDLAALWARGLLGAARYRSRRSEPGGNQRADKRTRQLRSKRRASMPSNEQ